MKPFAAMLVVIWGVPGAMLAIMGEKGVEELIANSPFAFTYIVITVAFLKHMSGMNRGRAAMETRMADVLDKNTEAMTTLKDEVRELRNTHRN